MKFQTMLGAALLCAAFDSQAALIHQYELNGSLNDRLGGAALVSGGGKLGPGGYAFTDNQGLSLQYALGAVYSIDMVYQFNQNSSYQRVIDFHYPTNSDSGLYTRANTYRFYPYQDRDGGKVIDKQDTRLTLTRDASSTLSLYVDGALAFSFTDSVGYADLTGRLVTFFRDDSYGSEMPTGKVDFIRVYDNALSATEVAALPGARQDTDVPEPASAALVLGGLGLLGFLRRRHK